MKTIKSLCFGLVLIVTSSANIIFTHIPLSCNITDPRIYHGCLRGQECNETGNCVVQDQFRPSPRDMMPEIQSRAARIIYSTDGACGPAHGNSICDPNSKTYIGGCCSRDGVCGNTEEHCTAGCISGCTVLDTRAEMASSPDSMGGAKYEGEKCDQDGYRGSALDHELASKECENCSTSDVPGVKSASLAATTAEPVIVGISRTMNHNDATATGKPTIDGTCGVSNGNSVCGNWRNGNCCSMYGFCGNTSSHCGAGCQSGNCVGAPVSAAPGPSPAPAAPNLGYFKIVGQSGVPAMHAGLLPNGRVFFLDKLENYTQLNTSNGYYAMSSEYDPNTNTAIPLAYKTNAFCSGGAFLADGSVVSLGGNAPLEWLDPNIGDGFNGIRRLFRSSQDDRQNGAPWIESDNNKLASNRWYASAQTMPNGTIFVASGSLNGLDPTVLKNNNPTYEILNADGTSQGVNIPMEILVKNQPYYMYPFVHLLSDGTLFIFVSKSSQVFNVGSNKIVKELPDLPGDYRTYPNTGGSVLLPLSSGNNWAPDIVICGGGAYQDITSPTDASCGRIQPLAQNSSWEMDSMPQGRGMVEGTLLPDGTVIWLNGGNRGAQGFELMSNPTLEALLYDPAKPRGQRFSTLAASLVPRLYHSVATLLLDGTVLVAGSNPVQMPKLNPDATDPYVTEFRVEKYFPPYLQGDKINRRPTNLVLAEKTIHGDGSKFIVTFDCPTDAQSVKVVLYHGGFVTHSVHMGHRMVYLDYTGWAPGGAHQTLFVNGPPNRNVAPPGPYVVYIVVDGVPSIGQFVQVV